MKRYTDLEIRVQGRTTAGYPVELTLNGEQTLGRGILSLSIVPWVPSADPIADGEQLFKLLFADERLKDGWATARGRNPQRRVRFRIDTDAPELHAIPWELLRDTSDGRQPEDVTATVATPFSRFLDTKYPSGLPITVRPVRVLVAIANPSNLIEFGLAPINVMQEWTAIKEATASQKIALSLLPGPCTLQALEAELKRGSYHILHLVAHGAFRKQDSTAVLFLADDDDCVQRVTDTEFRNTFAHQLGEAASEREDGLRLVFLASCETARRDTADAFRGLAPLLIAAGLPAVVAMQEQVPMDTAQAFTRTFYRRLLAHGMIDLAANEARSGVMSARLPGASIPVLMLRLRDGQLVAQIPNRKRQLIILACVVVLLALVGAFFLARPTLVSNLQTQGVEALEAGQGSLAINRFRLANTLMFGSDARVHYNLGNSYEQVTNNYYAAAAEYSQALALDDGLVEAYNNLARLYVNERHDLPGALEQLRSALGSTNDPLAQAVLHKNIGWAQLERKWQPEALEEFRKARDLFLQVGKDQFDVAAYLAETYALMARAWSELGGGNEAKAAWTASLGFALSVTGDRRCTDAVSTRKPTECKGAQAWREEAEHILNPASAPTP